MLKVRLLQPIRPVTFTWLRPHGAWAFNQIMSSVLAAPGPCGCSLVPPLSLMFLVFMLLPTTPGLGNQSELFQYHLYGRVQLCCTPPMASLSNVIVATDCITYVVTKLGLQQGGLEITVNGCFPASTKVTLHHWPHAHPLLRASAGLLYSLRFQLCLHP